MKTSVLLALGTCLALSFQMNAQNGDETSVYRDTLILAPNEHVKVLFIGRSMETMALYNRADSLKDYFLIDLRKARQQPAYPSGSKLTYYFVHPNGKRRLKAESEDYQEPALNVTKEIQSMALNLPPYAYIIHDIASGYELQIYLTDPDELSLLANIDLNEAIHTLLKSKRSERRFSNIALKMENGLWVRKAAANKKKNALEVHTSLGMGIVGSQLTPELGFELVYLLTDRYSIPMFKVGLSSQYNLFTEYSRKEFSDLYPVSSYNVIFMVHEGSSSSLRWVGFEAGYTKADGGSLDKNYKFGFVYAFRSVQVGINFYARMLNFDKPANDNMLTGFVVRSTF